MSHHKDFAFHIYPQDLSIMQPPHSAIQDMIKVYLISKYSLKNNPYIDIKNLIDNLLTTEEIKNINNIKTDFTYNEVMTLKNSNIDFYITDKERLSKIFMGSNVKNVKSNICYFQMDGKDALYFYNEYKFISFKGKMISNNNSLIKSSLLFDSTINKNKNDKNIAIADQKIQFQMYEIEHLKKQLEETKKQNEALKVENQILKNNSIKANNAIKENESLKMEINKLKNQNSDLNYQLQYQAEGPRIHLKDIIVVNFISGDSSIHYGIKCLPNDTFAQIEEKLYLKYDNYRDSNNTFLTNGKTVLRFKTLKENGIKDGDIVQLIVQE